MPKRSRPPDNEPKMPEALPDLVWLTELDDKNCEMLLGLLRTLPEESRGRHDLIQKFFNDNDLFVNQSTNRILYASRVSAKLHEVPGQIQRILHEREVKRHAGVLQKSLSPRAVIQNGATSVVAQAKAVIAIAPNGTEKSRREIALEKLEDSAPQPLTSQLQPVTYTEADAFLKFLEEKTGGFVNANQLEALLRKLKIPRRRFVAWREDRTSISNAVQAGRGGERHKS